MRARFIRFLMANALFGSRESRRPLTLTLPGSSHSSRPVLRTPARGESGRAKRNVEVEEDGAAYPLRPSGEKVARRVG
ncbi:hypothetical protein GGE15_007424 [Rhizobium esperanzae]|uniref:Uncharacterized protein n=1 Tax=Rhizobium esperanzae TaxID=1967781 RepID=A0A7W6UTN9_9HYPH|nr:hypothetical protein [Rhizobium esperanzae]